MSMVARHMDWEIVNPDAEWKRAQGSVFVMPVDGMITRCTRKESSLPL